jgi:hypothetical protein
MSDRYLYRSLPLRSITLFAAAMVSAEGVALSPNATIAEIHAAIITPMSDALFKAESSAPATIDEWTDMRRSADALAKSANLLASQERAKDKKQWMALARSLREESNRAAQAAKAKNIDALIAANGRIVAVCEGCHDDWRSRNDKR